MSEPEVDAEVDAEEAVEGSVAADADLGPGPAEALTLPARRWPKRVAVLAVVVLVASFFGYRELGTRPWLAVELLRMEDADRTAREQLAEANDGAGTVSDQARLFEAVDVLDHKHAERLAEMIDDHGWPDRSLVGRRGSRAALVLLRHARHDCDFQQEVLPLVEASDVPDAEVAALEEAIADCEG